MGENKQNQPEQPSAPDPAPISCDTSHGVRKTGRLPVVSLIMEILCATLKGLCVAAIIIVAAGALIIFLDSIQHHHGRAKARQAACGSNLKMQAIAMSMYCEDNDGRFPGVRHWNDALRPYLKSPKILICPTANDRTLPSYAANAGLQSRMIHKLEAPAYTVMLFDSAPGRNNFGGPDSPVYRHTEGCNFAFADGHVKCLRREAARTRGWKP